jgi:hypothetical protein
MVGPPFTPHLAPITSPPQMYVVLIQQQQTTSPSWTPWHDSWEQRPLANSFNTMILQMSPSFTKCVTHSGVLNHTTPDADNITFDHLILLYLHPILLIHTLLHGIKCRGLEFKSCRTQFIKINYSQLLFYIYALKKLHVRECWKVKLLTSHELKLFDVTDRCKVATSLSQKFTALHMGDHTSHEDNVHMK